MDDNEELTPAESAREKRRDHDAEARRRAGMRTGLAKQFKQVLDIQRRRADEAERSLEEERAADEQRRMRSKGKAKRP
jgi:anti-sigma regulatory factor (Ser/Thr protein kinase)